MISLFDLYSKNRGTFYNYASNEKQSLVKQRSVKFIFSLLMVCFFCKVGSPLFSTVITVYAILIGFSFSVLFFLLSIEFENAIEEKNVENRVTKKKLNTLLEELFYNVSYFNFISVSLVLVAFLSFLTGGVSEWFVDLKNSKDNYIKAIPSILFYVKYIYLFLFYYMFIESIFTFMRTTERISYFFQEKLKLKKQ